MDKEYFATLRKHLDNFLGYPCNTSYDYSEVFDYFKLNINNVGCPYTNGTYKVNSKDMEQDVILFFANLWGIKIEDTWAYITSAGTEGNMQGLFVGRESLGKDAIFYTSKDSHYSLLKIARLLCLNLCEVETRENGEMDYEDFERKLLENVNRPALINLNIGTTMKGAIDSGIEIFGILEKHNKQDDYYMHADGALMGFVLPFIEKDLMLTRHIHSISISNHKFLGCPFPCGIFMMEKRFLKLVSRDIEYIGSVDCMISGSRSGHTAILLKYMIDKKGKVGFGEDIKKCLELAEYVVKELPNSWRNNQSITIIFPKPSDEIVAKWQLATQDDISHIIVMPHVTKEKLDEFIIEYKEWMACTICIKP